MAVINSSSAFPAEGDAGPSPQLEEPDSTTARPSSPPQRYSSRPVSSDYLSDKATAALIRRTLCTRQLADRGRGSLAPIHDLLPPLTSRNDVDLQLYALISIILREYVQNWYNKITPDETFVAEILQIIAHCSRALEQRLRNVDLERLLFDELPELLAVHVQAYRISTTPTARPPLEIDPRQVYHSLCPLPALSPVPQPDVPETTKAQAENEAAYRQLLVQGVLAVLLPTEDLENECLTSLVGQLFSELIIGNLVATKVSEPWLIWEGLIMISRLVGKKTRAERPDPSSSSPADPIPSIENATAIRARQSWSLTRVFWSFIHWIFLIVGILRGAANAIALSWSLPPRSCLDDVQHSNQSCDDTGKKSPPAASLNVMTYTRSTGIPLIRFYLWSCIGDLLEMQVRMPWLCGTMSMMQWVAMKGPGAVSGFNGTLDRLFSHYVHTYVLDAAHLPPLLRAIRAAIFPNNAPGASSLTPPSSDEQLAALRRRCANALWDLLPKSVGRFYYSSSAWPWSGEKTKIITRRRKNTRTVPRNDRSAPGPAPSDKQSNGSVEEAAHAGHKDEDASHNAIPSSEIAQDPESTGIEYHDEDEARIVSEIEAGIVDIFSDGYCNKHLIYSVLELLLVRLVPELAERGIGELLVERVA